MLLMGNLHNYRGACQPRPCSPFRIGQVWRIWPATFDRCKNERTLHRAGAHAERGELTDKERERQTDRQPATAAAQLCGTVADAPAMWQAARTLNFSWNLNWLRVGHCHSWCHTVPACLPNASAADNTDISGRQPLLWCSYSYATAQQDLHACSEHYIQKRNNL